MNLVSKGILLASAASVAFVSPAAAGTKYFYREKAFVRPAEATTPGIPSDTGTGNGGTPTTPVTETPESGNADDNTMTEGTVSLSASSAFRLTTGDAVSGLTFRGNLPEGGSYRLAGGNYSGLEIDTASGTVRGTPTGSDGTAYSFRIEIVKDGSVVGQSSTVSGIQRDRLHIDPAFEDINIPAGGAFPSGAGIQISGLGGEPTSLSWSISGNPAWLGIQKTGDRSATLTFNGSITEDFSGTVSIVLRDGQGREAPVRQFQVTATALGAPVSFSVSPSATFTRNVNAIIPFTPSSSSLDGVTYQATIPNLNAEQVGGNWRVTGQPSANNGDTVRFRINAIRNGAVVGTSDEISGVMRDALQWAQTPGNIDIQSGQSFPTTNIDMRVQGGNQAGLTWDLIGQPEWLGVEVTGNGTARLIQAGSLSSVTNRAVQILVSDNEGRTLQVHNLTVNAVVPVPVTVNLTEAMVPTALTSGMAVNIQPEITGAGQPNVRFEFVNGAPCGAQINQTSGLITGTMSGGSGQACNFQVRAVNSTNNAELARSGVISRTIYPAPQAQVGNVNTSVSQMSSQNYEILRASQARGPYTFTVTSGNLPAWAETYLQGSDVLRIRRKSGETVTATPATDVVFEVRDADGRTTNATVRITITNG